jgi:hypothetical protein
MSSSRKISLVAGIFFLLTFIHVLILPLYDDVLNNSDFILGAGDVTLVRLGAIIEVITVIANVATGVILFQVLRRQHLGIALGYVGVRIFESTIICRHDLPSCYRHPAAGPRSSSGCRCGQSLGYRNFASRDT